MHRKMNDRRSHAQRSSFGSDGQGGDSLCPHYPQSALLEISRQIEEDIRADDDLLIASSSAGTETRAAKDLACCIRKSQAKD